MQKSNDQAKICCGPECCAPGTEIKKLDIKQGIQKQYGKIASSNSTESCSGTDCCLSSTGIVNIPVQSTKMLGYTSSDLQSIPEASILGIGCGTPLNFAGVEEGEIVVDLGSGAGIDVFIAANKVGRLGKAIGIDMTDEMLEKARNNAKAHGYTNVDFRKGDIEEKIPVEDNSVDLVVSNCVINLTTDKTATFRQVHRILKEGGRMIISDMVSDSEVDDESVDAEKWCACIDGALTKTNYLDSIRRAGFSKIEVIDEVARMDSKQIGGRNIASITVKALKGK